MASRKTRGKPKSRLSSRPKIALHLDPERWEEIAAIAIMILAALTALGAFSRDGRP